jgi:hypothetical protein
MRLLKYAGIFIVLFIIGSVSKEMIKNKKPSKEKIEATLLDVAEKLNDKLPNTVKFDDKEGIRLLRAEYVENVFRIHAVGLGHFESGETNKTHLMNYVLEGYCGDKLSIVRDANINFEYDIKTESRNLNDKARHTKISFTPKQCINFNLSKEANARS